MSLDNEQVLTLAREAYAAQDQYERACNDLLQKQLTLRQLAGYSDDLSRATQKLCSYLLTNAPLNVV